MQMRGPVTGSTTRRGAHLKFRRLLRSVFWGGLLSSSFFPFATCRLAHPSAASFRHHPNPSADAKSDCTHKGTQGIRIIHIYTLEQVLLQYFFHLITPTQNNPHTRPAALPNLRYASLVSLILYSLTLNIFSALQYTKLDD